MSSTSNLWLPPGTPRPEPTPEPKVVKNSPADLEREVLLDVYDHEVLGLETAFRAVGEKYEFLPATEDNLLAMVNEFVARAAELGFEVNVSFDYSEMDGVPIKQPIFSIVGRIDRKHEFDIERQQWEVQHNLLELDEQPGSIRRDGTIKSPTSFTSMSGSSKD